ncbi:retrovirus-related pol polyprotein from transposon TNT 1-94 [Tanacetum coccineum]
MKDKSALYLLFQSVDESGFEKITEATTLKEAWETLDKVYKGADRVKQVRLQTLPESKNKEHMIIDDLAGSLEGRERNYGGHGFGHSKSGGRGYDHGTESHSYDSNNCGKPGHYARNCRFPNMVEDGANDCYNYGKSGHYTRDCRLPKRVKENTNLMIKEEKVDGIVMMAYEEVVEEEALMTYEDVIGIDTQWYLDTATRNHMCSDKGLFSEMKEVVEGSVSFVNEAKVQVKEARTICFSHTRKQIPTEDEYHVPILNTKLEWCSQNNQNIHVDVDVDENMTENKENRDDEDLLEAEKMNKDSGFKNIAEATTSKEAWETLEKVYKGADQVKQVRLQTLRDGKTLTDSRVVKKILRSLTKKFENVLCGIEESKNIEYMTIDDLAGLLEAHEQRKIKKKQELFNDHVLQTNMTIEEEVVYVQINEHGRERNEHLRERNEQGRERNHGGRGFGHSKGGGRGYDHGTESHSYDCYNCGKPDHYARNYRFPKMVEDGANDCYNWGKSGHYARDCILPKRVEENTNLVIEEEKFDGIVMMAYEEVVEEEVLIAYEDVIGIDTQWYLDTAARNYMCSDKGLFLEMKEVVDGSVPFSDEAKVQVKEAGTICFSHTGKQIPTKD